MTPQEQGMLDGLIDRIRTAQLTTRDTEADRRIQEALGRDPNALYVLCQTVLLQRYALEQSQKQLAHWKDLGTQKTAEQTQHEPTFLEKIFGRSEPEPQSTNDTATAGLSQGGAPGYGSRVYNEAQYGQPGYTRPGYGQQQPYPAQPGLGTPYAPYGRSAPVSSGGGFLQGALQTAAGVALGEMAFQGLRDLFQGFGHAAGYGSDRAVGFGDVSATGGDEYGAEGGFFSREQAENGVNDQLSTDIEDRRGEYSSGFMRGDADALDSSDSATDVGYDVDNSVTEVGGSDFSGGDYDSDSLGNDSDSN